MADFDWRRLGKRPFYRAGCRPLESEVTCWLWLNRGWSGVCWSHRRRLWPGGFWTHQTLPLNTRLITTISFLPSQRDFWTSYFPITRLFGKYFIDGKISRSQNIGLKLAGLDFLSVRMSLTRGAAKKDDEVANNLVGEKWKRCSWSRERLL